MVQRVFLPAYQEWVRNESGNLATEQAKVPRKVTMSSADVWGKTPNNKLRGDDPPLIHDISGVFISRT